MKLSRRETLASMVAMAGAIGLGRDAVWAHEHNAGLHAAAKAKGMRFGSAVSAGNDQSGSFRNPQYAKLLQRDCGLLVAENEMKWQALRPGPDAFNFGPFDAIVAFAEKNALAIRGHTLLWHRPQWQPAWLEAYDFAPHPSARLSGC